MKSMLPQQFDSFFQSIETNNQIIYTEKIGLFDATITMIATSDININELLIYNYEGILLSSYKFKKEENDKNESSLIKINQFVKKFFIEKNEKNGKTSFMKISYFSRKIYFLNKSNLIFVGIFDINSKGSLIKLYLLHIYSAFMNFLGNNFDLINKNKKREENITVTSTGVEGNSYNFLKEILQIKIFEIFFLKSLTLHFLNIIKILFKKEELYITQYTKFKNLLVLDLSTDEIILNLKSVNNQKFRKFRKNEKLWQEIIHHSKFILKQYKSENNNKFDMTNSNYNFVKFECTSTFPRLLFVIKFLPILNGISIIHVLSQNKLSRKITDEELTLSRGYREIDIIHGRDFIQNNELDILYPEPKKLREIEKFLIEFYISTVNKENLFHCLSHELKYFDYYLLSVMDETANVYINNSFETIIKNIIKKLYEVYLNGIESENVRVTNQNHNVNNNINTNTQNNIISSANVQYVYNNDADSISIDKNFLYKDYKESNSDIGINLNINTHYMNINREFILKNIFQVSQLENQSNYMQNDIFNFSNINLNISKNDNTLLLSRIEETQSKMNPNENEQSFNLNFTDLSGIDNIHDDDGINNANNNLNNTNTRNNGNSPKLNPSNHLSANPFNKIKRNKDPMDKNGNISNDSFVKSNLSFFFNNKNNHNKLRQSYSNLNNKINPNVLRVMNLDVSDITENREGGKKSRNTSNNHLPDATENNINNAIDRAVKNLYNSQSFGYNSYIEKKRENYRKIPFNEKHLHSLSMDLDIKNNEDNSENMKKLELFQSFDNIKEAKDLSKFDEIKQNNFGDFQDNRLKGIEIPNFVQNNPLNDRNDIRQSAPTFRAGVPENNKIT